MHKDWIDCWKGLLILLVVTGHVVGAGIHLSTGVAHSMFSCVYDEIYFFHMPAFFFLVGYVWHDGGGFVSFLRKKINRLIIPYVVFGLLSILVYLLLGDSAHEVATASSQGDSYYAGMGMSAWWVPFLSLVQGGMWPNGEGFRCNSVLWFLPCMFVVQMTYFGLCKLADCLNRFKALYWVMVFVILQVLVALVAHHHIAFWPWGVSRIPWFGIFVLAGAASVRLKDRFKVCELTPLTGALCGVFVFVGLNWLYRGHHFSNWAARFLCHYLAVWVAIVGSILIALSMRGKIQKVFGALGVSSLGIMLMHKFVVAACQFKVPVLRSMFKHGTTQALLAAFVIIILATVMSYLATFVVRRVAPWAIGERRRK